jgi:ferrous iron transport protein A
MASGDSTSGPGGSTAVSPSRQREHRLADLAPGRRATVLGVVDGGDAGVARRLGELGFTPGATVEAVRRAPLRDPVIYRVKGYEICLRRAQAAYVRTVGGER